MIGGTLDRGSLLTLPLTVAAPPVPDVWTSALKGIEVVVMARTSLEPGTDTPGPGRGLAKKGFWHSTAGWTRVDDVAGRDDVG